GQDMAQIIYGRFAEQLLAQTASVETWQDIPPRLRQWAILWRDGQDVRCMMAESSFYRVKSQLKAYGIDLGVPCNVVALSKRVREVEIIQVSAAREAA